VHVGQVTGPVRTARLNAPANRAVMDLRTGIGLLATGAIAAARISRGGRLRTRYPPRWISGGVTAQARDIVPILQEADGLRCSLRCVLAHGVAPGSRYLEPSSDTKRRLVALI
jgi:hypothetical protein